LQAETFFIILRGDHIDENMKQHLRTILLLLATATCAGFAQPFMREVEPFPVAAGGSAITLPFTGGINSPLHQFVDIDGDGDYDLFIFDNDLNIDFYRNEGTQLSPRFTLRTGLFSLPAFVVWFRFLDFDGDGRIDICTEDSATYQGIRVFKNTGTQASPQFTEIISLLPDTTGAPVFTGGNSIPAFVDIDGDGDLDIISANISGTVNLYRNVGNSTTPRYAYTTGTWEGILIFGDTCTTALARPPQNAHGAAAYSFADIDGDGDADMFVGDLFWTGLFFIRNIGTLQAPHMQCVTAHFPPNNPLTTGGFNQTSFIDIDGDGDLDLFVGTLGGIVQQDGFIFYRNNGTPTSPLLQHVTRNYISTIDVGMNASPTFADIDGDGDQDLFIGNLLGKLMFFRNTGSASAPSFLLADSVYLSIPNGFYLAPAFADIDNDGDMDLFAGMYDGTLKFFRNNGTPQSPQFGLAPFITDTIDVGFNATPCFADIDGDGDLDLFIGNKDGRIRFYRNTGSTSVFIPQLVTASFLGIFTGLDTYVTPTFSDYDNDGDVDLFWGGEDGRIAFYENTGSATDPQFLPRTDSFANTSATQQSAPSFVDINGDGDKDLFVGVKKGGVHYYSNSRVASAGELPVPITTRLHQNFPNPFNPRTTITFDIDKQSRIVLRIFDMLGRRIAVLTDRDYPPGTYSTTWDARDVPSGVYFYILTTSSGTFSQKMIVLK
jgi:hypothetical protein